MDSDEPSDPEQEDTTHTLNQISVVFDHRKSMDSDASSIDNDMRRSSLDDFLNEFDYKDHVIYLNQYRKVLKTIMLGKSDSTIDSSISERIVQIESTVSDFVNNTIRNPGSHVIAQLVFYLYKHKYKVGRLKSKDWYMFNDLFWKQTEIGPYYELSTDVLNIYEYYLFEEKGKLARIHKNIKLIKQGSPTGGKPDTTNEHYLRLEQNNVSQAEDRVNQIEKIIEKLKNVSSKESICKECLYLFYDDSFLHGLDTNPNLVCFQNGVVDLVNNKFRKGNSNDHLSILVDMNFVVPKNDEEKNKLNDIFDTFHAYRKIIINKRRNRLIFTPSQMQ